MLPARRIAKSRDATPVASDSEDQPDAVATEGTPQEEAAAASKGKLRKAATDQQDPGPAKKRRKHSSSNIPEASESGQVSTDPDGEVRHSPRQNHKLCST